MAELRNIGPRGAARRAILGTAALAAAAILALVLILRASPPAWVLAVAPLVWLGSLGVLQARAKT